MADKGVRRGLYCTFLFVLIVTVIILLSLYFAREYSLVGDIRTGRDHQTRNGARRPHGSVLVTGGAGFIGFHTALRLVTERKWKKVVVVDNFNSYYNVGLKEKRASILLQQGVIVHHTDLCNERFLRHIFAVHKFTAVVHMAAQAGVSQSLVNPLVYVQANIACLTVLLDVLSDHKGTLLVYASSSSVYGQSSALPFSPLAPPSPPTNMYAASKQAGEQLVSGYCIDHGLLAVGLRFFTVYGPWGRPDMAVFKFAKKILAGDTVVLYKHGSHSVQRDFTYISDVVDCVMLALSHTPLACNEVYNVGRGQPEELETLLNYLEKELSQTANLEVQPLPLSELPLTQADISLTKTMLGYRPKIDLKTGVKLFVEWFVKYNQTSNQENEKQNALLQKSLKSTHSMQSSLDQKWTLSMNQAYEKRVATMRAKYIAFAKSKKIQLPYIGQKTFTFHPGVDSPGGTIMKAVSLFGTQKIPMLEAKCRDTEQCLAFNSRGEIKTRIQPKTAWVNVSGDDGLYIANVDVCAADLHECPLDATCLRTGSSQYTCLCKDGQVKLGKQCLDTYSPKRRSEAEAVQLLADQLDGVDWKGIVSGAQLVFFQGMDTPGGDYLYAASAVDDVTELTKSCLNTHRCIAFNTNGLLKHSVQPPNKWIRWTKNSHKGLYVLDVDYCSLAHDRCSSRSSCVKHAPGNYSCTCHPSRSWDSATDSCGFTATTTATVIHIVVSVDSDHFSGLLALVSSLQEYTAATQQVHVHVVISNDLPATVEQLLDCITLQKNIKVDVVYFDSTKLQGLVKVTAKSETVGNLASAANFARFFFHQLFPSLSHILYLDADTVVQADVTPLWDQLIQSDQLFIAAPRNKPTYKEMFRTEVNKLYYQRYQTDLQQDGPTFNAGVYGVNLAMWRKEGLHDEILYWMKQHMHRSLWQLGTQPLLLLVAHGRWEATDSRWNVNGLGWKTSLPHQLLAEAFILHWSGRRKPWLADGLYRQYWKSHYPKECSAQYQY